MTPWTVACQAPLSTGFSRQEHWHGWPVPPPGGHPNCVPGASQIFLPEYPTSTPNQNAQNLILLIESPLSTLTYLKEWQKQDKNVGNYS